MKNKYPDGNCIICGKVFKRPHKFRTQPEAKHELFCRFNNIKDNCTKEEISLYIDELEEISHIAGLGAGRDKELYQLMVDIQKILKGVSSN